MADLTFDQKYDLITANLQEVLNPEILQDVLKQRAPVIYWGTAITGRPHCGYFVPMLKIAQFLRAGCVVKILLADIHGLLDADKTSEEYMEARTEYYRFAVENMLKAVGVSLDKLQFIKGSEFQEERNYVRDERRLMTKTSLHDAAKAGSDVVKQMESPPVGNICYPLMQALDEEYLGVDAQFGGLDQRKIFTFAKDALPKIGYRQRAHLMNPMVPGLTGGKMSSSEPESKIDVLDDAKTVDKKIKKAFAEPKKIENNGLLSFVEYVLLPASELKTGKGHFVVERERDGKEPLVYEKIEQMRDDYANDVLTPQLLKQAIRKELSELLKPIQDAFEAQPDAKAMVQKAYPEPGGKEKPAKDKKKDKGNKKKGEDKKAQEEKQINGQVTEQSENTLPTR